MTLEKIQMAQDYLTISNGSGKTKVLNIETLLKRHPPEQVITLLERLSKEKRNLLKDLIADDITSSEIDKTIALWFRISMTINFLKEEVMHCEKIEYQTGRGC